MREIFPPKASTVSPPEALTVTIPLKLLTPMIGGGVEALTPDPRNPARATAIRGAWRWWWRALQPEMDLAELHRRETLLFGGVGKGDGEIKASLIRVRTRVLTVGQPVGVHEWIKEDDERRKNQKPRMPPFLWQYAMFPLTEGKSNHPEMLATLQLELNVGIDPGLHVARTAALGDEGLNRAMEALRWWIHFGGLGGRTRRGFGAIALAGKVRFSGAPRRPWEAPQWWEEIPVPPSELRPKFVAPRDRPSLIGAAVLRGATEKGAMEAHGMLVSEMAWFRQGTGFGRDPGTKPRRPGESRWPEVTLAKLRLEKSGGGHRRAFEHPIREDAKGCDLRTVGAPRAAFGMPLLIKFKPKNKSNQWADGDDTQANCDLVPQCGGRWPSPVILRPIQRADGAVVPVVLVLTGGAQISKMPSERRGIYLKLKISDARQNVPQEASATGAVGARDDIRTLLDASDGDAITAFVSWLEDDLHFQKVTP